MTEKTKHDEDAMFLGSAISEVGARLVFMMVVKGADVDEAEAGANEVAYAIIEKIQENFNLDEEQIEDLKLAMQEEYNDKILRLIKYAREGISLNETQEMGEGQ